MIRAQDLLGSDEELRLRDCAEEPIHLPGAIQPHGALLAVDADSHEVLQVSANCEEVLGISVSSLLGSNVDALIGVEAATFLQPGFVATTTGSNWTLAEVNGRAVTVIVHLVGDVGVVEFEPVGSRSDAPSVLALLRTAIHRLSHATDVDELRRLAVHEIRALTGFDQVMIYHFHADGHGEVMADEHEEGMMSYSGLHFPASDIPAQARRLYSLKSSGAIGSSDYEPVALIPVDNPKTGGALDLSRAELRSVSPHHLQFMRNMGQGASMTLSLVLNGKLLGLITCAHREPRRISFWLRQVSELIAQQVVLLLDVMSRTQQLTNELGAAAVRKTLVDQMRQSPHFDAGLIGQATLLNLTAADGAAVIYDHRFTCVGDTPSHQEITRLLQALTREDGSVAPLLSESLVHDRPELAPLVPNYAGVFVQPFGSGTGCVIWFRCELAQSIDWMGAQSLDNRATPLSPRTSFNLWRQTVTDRSARWDDLDIAQSVELARDIDQELLRRAEARMADMALHDSLTGVPNRRFLADRITSGIERAALLGKELAILFCDLDDFKRINDTAGHDVGDAVLIEAARRLQSVLRAGDSIARVGGDEFVVVLEPTEDRDPSAIVPAHRKGPGNTDSVTAKALPVSERTAALQIAERIRAELARPIRWQGDDYVISVSVGISFATPGGPAKDVLGNADRAMYRAKQAGRNCVAVFDDSLSASVLEQAEAEHALATVLGPGHQQNPPPHPNLSVLYRPMTDTATGRLIGFEARPHLTNAAGRAISPEVLDEVAERTGMIVALSETVLEASLAALVEWQTAHPAYRSVIMAVTISSVRLAQHVDLPSLVATTLDRHGLQPSDLWLELTESAIIDSGDAALDHLIQLHDIGVGIGVNKFGTGHANLRHLSVLPIDAIKVDPSFTAGLPDDATSIRIVRAVAGLAADLDLACVFDGIDSHEQFAALPVNTIGMGLLWGVPSTVPRFESVPDDARN